MKLNAIATVENNRTLRRRCIIRIAVLTAMAGMACGLFSGIAAEQNSGAAAPADRPISFTPGAAGRRPKLIVWITLDAMRGDIPLRYRNPETSKGLKFLIDNGTYYANANYGHSCTFTAAGHATLFTGAHAAQHGIADNDWHDIESDKDVYSVQDNAHPVLGGIQGKCKGYSPANLQSTTIGDELVLSSAGRSRVFSVSGKDRGAILPGGHLGKAFWFMKEAGGYVSSDYYYKDYPAWFTAWAAGKPADAFRDKVWTLLDAPETYLNRDRDDVPFEKGYKYLDNRFPHAMATEKAGDYYAALQSTPFYDELAVQLATELLKQEKVGLGEVTDMLALSLSATDYIHHNWGPDSLEAEDNLRRVDELLGRFFITLDDHVGLANTLILLSADHGMDSIPEYKKSLGYDAGRHDVKQFLATVNGDLKKRFKTDKDLVKTFWNPSIYLDEKAVAAAGLDLEAVERAIVEQVVRIPGFAAAVTRSDLLAGRVTDTPINRRLQLAFHPTRSGHVLVLQSQNWYLYPESQGHAAMHGSPYAYDTFVPIFVAGAALKPATIRRPVQPEDLASTVAAVLGINAPSGNVGIPLTEVIETMQSPCLAR